MNDLKANFRAKYGSEPRLFRAPGRVNLIGEHTDYNDGFVMPCAIDFATVIAAAARDDRKIHVASMDFEKELEFDLDAPPETVGTDWTKYAQGVAYLLEEAGHRLRGANLLIASDVPVGAGLSSSAALEVALGLTLSTLAGAAVEKWEIALTGQRAEHEYAGVRSGIMDQFASIFGVENHALFLDCRSLDWSPIPLSEARFIICNTKTKHDLADGEYNKRRAECEAAAQRLGVASLRDVAPAEFAAKKDALPELLRRRAGHVVTENQRVLDAVDALRGGALDEFGRLMNLSHESLRDDYEVSCRELDIMVELARRQKGVLGARMTGGGFGGCTVNLLGADAADDVADRIAAEYRAATGIEPEIYVCRAAAGAAEVDF